MKNAIKLGISFCFVLLISFGMSHAQTSSTTAVPNKKNQEAPKRTIKSNHPGKIQVVKRSTPRSKIAVYNQQKKQTNAVNKQKKMTADVKKNTPKKEE